MKKRLALIISAPVLVAALLSAGLLYLIDVRNATQRIESEALDNSNVMLTHLQNILNTHLVSGNLEDARLSLSVSAMHAGVETLLLSDEQDWIMLANHYIWEGEPATILGEYDVALARQVRLAPAPVVRFSAQRNRLRGYYPVTIRIVEKEMGLRKLGVLFFEYDITAKLAKAQRDAAIYAMWFGATLLLSAILVSLLLGRLVSKRILKLVGVTRKFAKGESGVRANMTGSDEIAFLGQAFDVMAEQREKVEQALANDIKERNEVETLLRVSEERLKEAQRIAQVGSWELDLVQHKLIWSDEIFNLFEIDKAQFSAAYEAFLNAIHPDDRDMVNQAYSNSLITRSPYEVTHRLKMSDGRIKWVHEHCSTDFDAGGKPLRSVGTVQNITRQREAEESLRLSEERLRDAQRIGKLGTVDWNLATNELLLSDEAVEIYCLDKNKKTHTLEEVINLLHLEDKERVEKSLQAAVAGTARHDMEHRMVCPDGKVIYIRATAELFRDEKGNPARLLGTIMDITERKRHEEALKRFNQELEQRVAQRTALLLAAKEEAEAGSRSKSLFLTSMSHELRTPLNAILGFAQLMQLDTGLPAHAVANAHEIKQAGDHLLALMNDILDLARIESGRMDIQIKNFDLLEVLKECHAQNSRLAANRNITLVFDDSCRLIKVRADNHRLLQVLNNLVSNAIKYNRDGGKVTISCVAAANGRIRISVIDTGLGIAPDKQAQLFQPFNRLGAEMSTIEGTGIGLVISRRLLDAMDGIIGVDSVHGKGSTFWVELPTPESAMSSAISEPVAQRAVPSQPPRVLVADDYVPNQNVLRTQLLALGCAVEVVPDGAEALKKYRAAPYDLILTDLNMPIMDGPALAMAIRKDEAISGGHIPIVAVTAAAMPSELKRCREAGMDDTLTKPIALVGLRAMLTRWLGFTMATPAFVKMDASAGEDSAILNLTHLYLTLGQVDLAQARSLIATFISAAGEGLTRLASQADDRVAVSREMHKQKSSARTVGALRYAQLAEMLEQRTMSGETTGMKGSLAALRHALTEIEKAAADLDGYKVAEVSPAINAAVVRYRSALIVDDDPVVLQQLTSMLAKLGMAEVLTARNGREAMQMLAARNGKIELLLCDLNMPEMDGVELIREFGKAGFDGGLILISGADEKVLNTVSRLAGLQGLRVLGQLRKPVLPAQIISLLSQSAEVSRQKLAVFVAPEVSPETIHEGIAGKEFSIWFQPTVDSSSLRAVGVEALARWKRPDGRFISPDIFIAVAEQSGLIGQLSQVLLATTLGEGAKLLEAGFPLKISVNLSARWLDDLNLPDFILAQTKAAKLEVADFILEVTETGVMEDLTTALDVLTRLRIKGFGLSIDDFGIGYSSFEQLGRIPFTEMKLDRSFVNKGTQDAAALAILEGSMDMARKLGLTTVAEGVETETELELIRSLGCDRVQGYLVAKAMPLDELLAWLRSR